MKGIVFTEFIEMMESQFGLDTADRVIEAADLPSGGAFTSVGTYDHQELVALVVRLGAETNRGVPDLVRAFGRHLFGKFVVGFPQLFDGVEDAFDLLSRVDDHIHMEVRKLYPDAELPRIECKELQRGRLEVVYRSSRGFGDLAQGLIEGCIEHYGKSIELARQDLPATDESTVRFVLTETA